MDINEIKWRIDDAINAREKEIHRLQQKLTIADKERNSCTNALMTCRGMLEQALPHLSGTPIEEDFRLYLNIISGVIGDFSWKQADIVTPEEHGKWLDEQLNKRDY